jgi:Ca2+-transporting ATPase
LVLSVALQLAAVYMPFLQRVLRTTALPPPDLLIAFAAAASVLLAVEAWKWVVRRQTAGRLTNSASLGAARVTRCGQVRGTHEENDSV